jgi:hypothetical protein
VRYEVQDDADQPQDEAEQEPSPWWDAPGWTAPLLLEVGRGPHQQDGDDDPEDQAREEGGGADCSDHGGVLSLSRLQWL